MYSYVKLYEKDNEKHEIYFPVRLKGVKRPKKNSNTFIFDENNITTKH